MTQTLPTFPLALDLSAVPISDAQFARIVADNPELRLELSAQEELIVMSPTGGKTGRRNSRIIQRLLNWSGPWWWGHCLRLFDRLYAP